MRKTKQVLVLRKDLSMRKGKFVSQGSHASMKVLLDMMKRTVSGNQVTLTLTCDLDGPLWDWIGGLFTKVCVYVNSEEELLALHEKSVELGIPCCLITDSGATEFKGVPTNTAVSIGPAYADEVDLVTGGLPLL